MCQVLNCRNERFKLCQHNRYLISCIDFSFLGGKLWSDACARLFPATVNISLNLKCIHCSYKSVHVHVLCADTRTSQRSAHSSRSPLPEKCENQSCLFQEENLKRSYLSNKTSNVRIN